jgi:hypothetical protein
MTTTTNTIRIPKFRKVERLLEWMSNSGYRNRLPAEIEEIFFGMPRDARLSTRVAQYANYVGPLDARFEQLLVHNNRAIVDYAYVLNCYNAPPLPDSILERLKGDDSHLLLLARRSGRLPTWLEDTITSPKTLLSYADLVLKGRLPEHLEELLLGDVNAAVDYAFKVIRGRSSVRLPDRLHSFVTLKSFETTDNNRIKDYFEEVGRHG